MQPRQTARLDQAGNPERVAEGAAFPSRLRPNTLLSIKITGVLGQKWGEALMPVISGTNGHDYLEGTAGPDVMIGGSGSDTYVVNNAGDLVLEDADPVGSAAVPWWGTTAEEPITLIRTGAAEYWVRIQIEGAPDGLFAEFRLEEVSPGVLGINGLRVADAAGEMPEVVLSDSDSVWEYAFQLGRPSEDGSPTEFEWYGGGHGSQQLNSLGLMLDGIDFSALPLGTPVNGSSLSVVQDLQIMLPTDRVTPAGSALLQHVFDSSGMLIQHAHAYSDGFELGRAYSGMMPATGAGAGGIDWMQVGDGPAHRIVYDGTSWLEEGRPTYATAWGDDHNFQIRMSLPYGGPDVNGDWSRAEPWGMWLWDTENYSKIYLNWLEGGAANYAAISSEHATHYAVSLRDITIPTGVTPLGPRSASQGVDTILASISLALPDNVEILHLTGSENLSGFGNNLNNTLIGNAGNNTLDGRAGADLMYGGAGDDTYLVRTSDDYVEEKAGEGTDTILTLLSSYTVAAHFENLVYLGAGVFTATGNGANNRIQSNGAADTLRGLDGDDELSGGGGDDTLLGGLGDDRLLGGGGSNLLLGEEGDDTLDSRGGQGTLQGGTGNDTYLVDSRTISIVEAAAEGVDEVRVALDSFALGAEVENLTFTGSVAFTGVGNGLANTITGGASGDLLNGQEGDDHLRGLAGSDLLLGGAGNNVLDGGAGADTAYYVGGPAGVDLDLRNGGGRNAHGGADILIDIEHLTGTSFADSLAGNDAGNTLNGAEGDDLIAGRGGADILMGGAGVDTLTYAAAAGGVEARLEQGLAARDGDGSADSFTGFENLTGSSHDDLLRGDALANVLRGGAGADDLGGLAGNDVLDGGAGAANVLAGGLGDDLYVVSADDVIIELQDQGVDAVEVWIGNYALSAHVETMRFVGTGNFVGRGNAQGNGITGGAGDDVLSGAGGQDTLNGGAGIDTVDYSLAATGVSAQLNTARSTNDGDGATDIFVSVENLTGSAFSDVLIGDAQTNALRGGAGADTLLGLGGNDLLAGGSGALNTLQGGLGDDWYILEAADSVHEFFAEGTDTVEARINVYVLAGNVENLMFTGSGDFRGTGNGLANIINGAAGNDLLRGGGGADSLNGGDGADTADYILAASGVVARVDFQTSSNDGDGSADAFSSIEHLVGSNYADLLVGNASANRLSGGLGADLILGGAGDDILSGGGGELNQLQGGLGDDWYILDAVDTCVENAGEGIDTVEARVGNYVLRANIENLVYTGATKFVGTGNALDNIITGGEQNDILRGMGGRDTVRGGGGADELQVRGAATDYTITAQGGGWLIVDNVSDRDGSAYVESIEVVRFLTGNSTRSLAYASGPTPQSIAPESKGEGSAPASVADDPFVLPGQDQPPSAKDDLAMVLPRPEAPALFDVREVHLPESGHWMLSVSLDADVWGL